MHQVPTGSITAGIDHYRTEMQQVSGVQARPSSRDQGICIDFVSLRCVYRNPVLIRVPRHTRSSADDHLSPPAGL